MPEGEETSCMLVVSLSVAVTADVTVTLVPIVTLDEDASAVTSETVALANGASRSAAIKAKAIRFFMFMHRIL